MEVTTVSPPPTSPTEGDGPCGIDVTSVALGALTLLICLCGLVGNGAVLCLLGFSIRRNPITIYIFHLAIADFAFLLLIISSTVLLVLEHVSCSTLIPHEYLVLLFPLFLFSYNLGLDLLTAIGIERCKSTLCPLWFRCRCPEHQSKVVSAMLWATSITVIPTVTSLFLFKKIEQIDLVLMFMYILNLLLFVSSMVISSTSLFMKVKCGSQPQPPERLDTIIFLMVLFGLPCGLYNFLHLFGSDVYTQVVFLLASIHSSSKPFICFSVGRCWRHRSMRSLQLSLQRLLGEPEENTACSNDAAMDTAV